MFYYVLVICSGYNGPRSCLPPAYYTSSETCVRIGNAYRRTGGNTDATCTQVPKKDVR